MGLLQVIVNNAVSRAECQSRSGQATACEDQMENGAPVDTQNDTSTSEDNPNPKSEVPCAGRKRTIDPYDILLQLPESDLRSLCSLLAHGGYVS